MVDRLELAKQYVQEMLERRDDIVGAFVGGSVARGEATEASDIDLILIVDRLEGEEFRRAGIDEWREGVYLDAALAPSHRYDDTERVLTSYFQATQMNDALILYDPTARFTWVQAEVRAAFNKPEWLRVRMRTQMRMLCDSLSEFEAAVSAEDIVGVCQHEAWVSHCLASVPLVRNGVSPSSTRSLLQLESVSPEWKRRICGWEGSTRLGRDDVPVLIEAVAQGLELGQPEKAARAGDLGTYFAKKAQWLAGNGHTGAAIHITWFTVDRLARIARDGEDEDRRMRAAYLLQTWLQAVGWEGQAALEKKARVAAEMARELELTVADLLKDED
jgi:predicted nucleotidyltransferase